MSDEREVERGVVNAPADGDFGGVVAEGEEIGGEARASHGALREAVPVGAKASLEHEEFGDGPGILEVAAGLGVGDVRSGGASECGGADETAGDRRSASRVGGDSALKGLEGLDFSARGAQRIG